MENGHSSIAPRLALPYRAILLALGLLAAGLLLEQLIDLVLLVVITVIVTLPIAAGATRLQRLHIPRVVGAPLCLLAGLALIGLIAVFVVPSFVHEVDGFVAQLPRTSGRFERSIDHAFGFTHGTVATAAQRVADRYTQDPAKLLGPLSALGLDLATGLGSLVVMLITALYAAINPGPLVRGFVRLVPPAQRPTADGVLERIRSAWLGWLRGMSLDMLILGSLLFVGLELIGLPFAAGFAVFSALMTVIPNYGSVISAVPPIAYGLSQSLHQAVLVTIVYIVVNQIEGNVALPLIMGRSVSVHPAAVAIGVLITGALFGPLGLVLSVPLMSLALILIEELWIKPRQAPRRAGADPAGGDAHRRTERAVFGAIAMGALLIVLGLLAEQLVTLLLAVMFTVILSLPLAACATRLERLGVPRALGAVIGLLAGVLVLAGLAALLLPRIIDQVRTLTAAAPRIVHTLELRVARLTGERPGHVADRLQSYVSTYVHHPSQLLGPIASIGLSAATVVGGVVIAAITACYIAARPQPLTDGLAALFGPARHEHALTVMARLRDAWLGWLKGVALSMAIVGVLLYVALGPILGLQFALAFAVLSGIAEVVPYLGALLSGIPPTAYALTISPGRAVAVLAIYIAVHQFEANVIGPLVMSRAVHMHPALIAMGVVAVGEVFGLLGLMIAVPILSSVLILGEELWVAPMERRRWRSEAALQRAGPARKPAQTGTAIEGRGHQAS